MPVMFTFMFLWAPSGLVLYWLVSNVLGDRPADAHEPPDRSAGAARRPAAGRAAREERRRRQDRSGCEGARPVNGTADRSTEFVQQTSSTRWGCRSTCTVDETPDGMRIELVGRGRRSPAAPQGRGARRAPADRQHGVPPRARRRSQRSSSTAWAIRKAKDAELQQMARFLMEKAQARRRRRRRWARSIRTRAASSTSRWPRIPTMTSESIGDAF